MDGIGVRPLLSVVAVVVTDFMRLDALKKASK